jgi:hypothetical protein
MVEKSDDVMCLKNLKDLIYLCIKNYELKREVQCPLKWSEQ